MASFCFHLLLRAHLSLTPRVSTLFFLSHLACLCSALSALWSFPRAPLGAELSFMFPDANSSIIFTQERDVVN